MRSVDFNLAAARVMANIDGMRDDCAHILADLVSTPSVNPSYPGCSYDELVGGETAANELLAGHLGTTGCDVTWVEREAGRGNVVAVLHGGGGGSRSLALNGHIDVVPPGSISRWEKSGPFSGEVIDGRVHGRGACDAKGGLVAAVIAVTALVEARVRLVGDLVVQSVIGEETGEHDIGIRAVLEDGPKTDAAIVCEPTGIEDSFAVAPASGGLLWMTLRVSGRAGHNNLRGELVRSGGIGALAGVNAVEKAIFLVTMLQDLERQWGQSKSHHLFKPGWFGLHPGVIVGGPAGILVPFMISEHCTVEYSVLYPPNEKVEDIEREIEDFVTAASRLDPWLREHPPEIEWRLHWPPFSIEEDHELVSMVVDAHRLVAGLSSQEDQNRVQGFAAVCDATYIQETGVPAVVYGPGTILQAHRADESVAVDEVVAAAKTYAMTALGWCGMAGPDFADIP